MSIKLVMPSNHLILITFPKTTTKLSKVRRNQDLEEEKVAPAWDFTVAAFTVVSSS